MLCSSNSSPLIPALTLLLSLPVLFFLIAPRILPPRQIHISLTDELDDLSLFQKASALESQKSHNHPSSKSRLGATNPHPKIAFLFLTNSDLYFAPLWQIFFNNQSESYHYLYNIYIHSDPIININPPEGVFEGKLIPSKRTQRSSPTLISAARRLLATALLDDPFNMYFALISQHCIPLHSFHYLYQTLFIPRMSQNLDFGYRSFIEITTNEPIMWDRYNARGKDVMLPEVPFDKFKVGSQFFVLNRKHSLLVVRDRKFWRKFRLPCLKIESCYPEEHYFPTLLSMIDPEGCAHYALTRVNWTDSVDGHPHTYKPPEVSAELIYKLRQSNSTYPFMFARKFSSDCLEPLLKMADSVIFRD